jgi:hypothetical protein
MRTTKEDRHNQRARRKWHRTRQTGEGRERKNEAEEEAWQRRARSKERGNNRFPSNALQLRGWMNEGVDAPVERMDEAKRVSMSILHSAYLLEARLLSIGLGAAPLSFVSSCLVAPLPSPFALWFIILLLLG